MPVPFIMPKFDMDQEQATIVSWSKKEGDFVKFEETVLVVETDKVAIDVPAPATGILAGIRFKQGDVVPVTTVIAYILKEGETLAGLPGAAAPAPHSAGSARARRRRRRFPQRDAHRGSDARKKKALTCPGVRHRATRSRARMWRSTSPSQQPAGRVTVPATPSARRVARESGVPSKAWQGRARAAVSRPATWRWQRRPWPRRSSRPSQQPALRAASGGQGPGGRDRPADEHPPDDRAAHAAELPGVSAHRADGRSGHDRGGKRSQAPEHARGEAGTAEASR